MRTLRPKGCRPSSALAAARATNPHRSAALNCRLTKLRLPARAAAHANRPTSPCPSHLTPAAARVSRLTSHRPSQSSPAPVAARANRSRRRPNRSTPAQRAAHETSAPRRCATTCCAVRTAQMRRASVRRLPRPRAITWPASPARTINIWLCSRPSSSSAPSEINRPRDSSRGRGRHKPQNHSAPPPRYPRV